MKTRYRFRIMTRLLSCSGVAPEPGAGHWRRLSLVLVVGDAPGSGGLPQAEIGALTQVVTVVTIDVVGGTIGLDPI